MPKFKVYAERTESYCAIIEAETEEEAREKIEENISEGLYEGDFDISYEICCIECIKII